MRAKHGTQGATSGQRLVAVLLAAGLVTVGFGALAQAPEVRTEETKLTPTDGGAQQEFGGSVAVDGDRALVGAGKADGDTESLAGAVYVFARNGTGAWNKQAKLTALDGERGDGFGGEVVLRGDLALISATGDHNANGENAGAVYVFARDGPGSWSQQAKLVAGDGAPDDRFGSSVALHEGTALVGASLHDLDGLDTAGSAYVFTRESPGTWSLQAKLTASDADAGDEFGRSVALDGDTALVGTLQANTGYVYYRSGGTWSQSAKIVSQDVASRDLFGSAVALHGDRALLGAQHDDNANGEDAGSAYVFERTAPGSWSQQAKLTAEDGAPIDRLGESVALDGAQAVVGSKDVDGERGAAYVFAREAPGSWSQQAKLVASDGAPEDWFADTLDVDSDLVFVGARRDDNANGVNAGAAYVFANRTTEEQVHDETQNDAGTGGDASDDPDDPTPLPGGELIHINGTLVLGSDEVDAYGTNISEDTTRSMLFNFTIPAGMPVNLSLLSPNGSLADSDATTLAGGQVLVEAPAQSDGFLEAGEWVTVLEIEAAPGEAPSAGSSLGLVFPGPGASEADGSAVADPSVALPEDGVVPSVVPDRFTVVDYRDERPCDPKC